MKIDNRYLSSSVRASIKQYKGPPVGVGGGRGEAGLVVAVVTLVTGSRVTTTHTYTHRASAGTWGRTQSVLCLKTKE